MRSSRRTRRTSTPAVPGDLNEALIDRLTLTEARIAEMAKGVREIADLDDPVGEVVEGWTLENGLEVPRSGPRSASSRWSTRRDRT